MAELELFDGDGASSRIIVSVFETNDGFLGDWELELFSEQTMKQVFALRDAIEFASRQFEKLIDMMIEAGHEVEEDNGDD